MASLSSIINSKAESFTIGESNLEQGQIYFYTIGSGSNGNFVPGSNQTWASPGAGTATVEIWGASGSAGKMCCCGWGLPGNPGAYSKKTFAVNSASCITMDIGQSCGNDSLCYRGRSEPTCVCYIGTTANGTVTAEGGRGGFSVCVNGGSTYCCLVACGFPGQLFAAIGKGYQGGGNGCGLICNYVAGEIATATGGDINLSGGWSCTTTSHCNPCCMCYHAHHVRTSPGLFTQCGNVITFNMECGNGYSQVSGNGVHQLIAGLNALSRTPVTGQPYSNCWSGFRECHCYESAICMPYVPHGVPGVPSTPCDGVRTYGMRGGHGAVRITFVGS